MCRFTRRKNDHCAFLLKLSHVGAELCFSLINSLLQKSTVFPFIAPSFILNHRFLSSVQYRLRMRFAKCLDDECQIRCSGDVGGVARPAGGVRGRLTGEESMGIDAMHASGGSSEQVTDLRDEWAAHHEAHGPLGVSVSGLQSHRGVLQGAVSCATNSTSPEFSDQCDHRPDSRPTSLDCEVLVDG